VAGSGTEGCGQMHMCPPAGRPEPSIRDEEARWGLQEPQHWAGTATLPLMGLCMGSGEGTPQSAGPEGQGETQRMGPKDRSREDARHVTGQSMQVGILVPA